MKENSIYIYQTGSLYKGSHNYYLTLTHNFSGKVLNATHIFKYSATAPIEFYVSTEIYNGSPIWQVSREINTEELKRMVINDVFQIKERK